MFDEMNASIFTESKELYEAELFFILSKIFVCHKMMISSAINLKNDEEVIRDSLYTGYLNSQEILNEVDLHYHFECEPKEFGVGEGYLDIKVFNQNIFTNAKAYYTIECKRLDKNNPRTKNGLNGKYIKDGIMRFVDKKYPSFYRVSAMIGFVVDDLDSHKNIDTINYLLKNKYTESKTIEYLSAYNAMHYYKSRHHDADGSEFILLHQMLNFSSIIALN